MTSTPLRPTRRGLLTAAAAGTGLIAVPGLADRAVAGAPYVQKPLPSAWFYDYGTNAEMRWESVSPREYLTSPERLFVRDHTATPSIDASTYTLRIFGDALATPRASDQAVSLSYADLRSLPVTRLTTVHECTGNGRSFFASQQGTPAPGTQWKLGAVGAVAWEGVRLATVLERVGLDPRAVSVMATGLDADYVSGGVDYGPVRRPFPVSKALDDALLVWGADGRDLLPDHGFPIRLVLPGWVGIASIKWLGSLEVSATRQTSPWNTIWYRMTGGSYPPDSPPLTVNPVRSALELAWGATLARRQVVGLTGRSWSGAGPIDHVDVSTDGGGTWQRARIRRGGHREAWTQWEFDWRAPSRGDHVVMARATDVAGRQQPLVTPYNENGYFFDAVVRHPVTIV
ncbi:molybdopterin-dependent oxidoreductase [Nocardioides cynanchi]|uniref:molybdopterin-dependent oxidoreductase n=1 Tax=Nocardioides cynanchi TaxID=2558918 RepID=UPI001247E6C8|nr:molybdopterin-dependent oxidoreductase [Nocardioides cynanchi]